MSKRSIEEPNHGSSCRFTQEFYDFSQTKKRKLRYSYGYTLHSYNLVTYSNISDAIDNNNLDALLAILDSKKINISLILYYQLIKKAQLLGNRDIIKVLVINNYFNALSSDNTFLISSLYNCGDLVVDVIFNDSRFPGDINITNVLHALVVNKQYDYANKLLDISLMNPNLIQHNCNNTLLNDTLNALCNNVDAPVELVSKLIQIPGIDVNNSNNVPVINAIYRNNIQLIDFFLKCDKVDWSDGRAMRVVVYVYMNCGDEDSKKILSMFLTNSKTNKSVSSILFCLSFVHSNII